MFHCDHVSLCLCSTVVNVSLYPFSDVAMFHYVYVPMWPCFTLPLFPCGHVHYAYIPLRPCFTMSMFHRGHVSLCLCSAVAMFHYTHVPPWPCFTSLHSTAALFHYMYVPLWLSFARSTCSSTCFTRYNALTMSIYIQRHDSPRCPTMSHTTRVVLQHVCVPHGYIQTKLFSTMSTYNQMYVSL